MTVKQLSVLEMAVDTIKDYFYANGNGLKEKFLLRSSEMQALQQALMLYTQTTGALIKTFVQTQTQQG